VPSDFSQCTQSSRSRLQETKIKKIRKRKVTWQLHKKMQHRRDHRSTTWWNWDKTNQTSVELKKIKHEQMRTGVLGPDSSQGMDEPKKITKIPRLKY
jgi:hypothetical protein